MAGAHSRARITKSPDNKTVIDFKGIERALQEKEIRNGQSADGIKPDELLTSREIARLKGCSASVAKRFVNRCVEAGVAEVGHKIIPRIGGTYYPAVAYRFKKEWIGKGGGK